MKNYSLIKMSFITLAMVIFCGCEANQEDFGRERVCLSQAMTITPIESELFNDNTSIEPGYEQIIVHVAGVSRSGEMLSPANLNVELEVDANYLEERIAELESTLAEDMTDELTFLKNNSADMLPLDCYEFGTMYLSLPSESSICTLDVKLNLDRIKELDFERTWFIPAIKIKTASGEINNIRERTLSGFKFSTKTNL